jgi:peptide deformylase
MQTPARLLLGLGLLLGACSTSRPVQPGAPMTLNAHPIVQSGEAVLRGRAVEIEPQEFGSPALEALVARMVETMRAAPGVGLAAPQIGVAKRVIVFEDPEAYQLKLSPAERAERERVVVSLQVLVNPVLTPIGDERATFFEGCLSVAGFVGLVERAREVQVTGFDARGKPVSLQLRGWPARILQHEVDHLNGTLYVDRMMPRSFSTAEAARTRFAGKAIAEILRELGL